MSARTWALLTIIAGVGWWYSPLSPRVPPVAATAPGYHVQCPLPPRSEPDQPPLQSPLPPSMPAFHLAAAELQALAGFSVDARVLSRQDYHLGRETELSPTDLAMGWGRMREDAVLAQLDIRQSSRWYEYRWRGDPPLPPREIARSSANMHMIPADAPTAAALHRVRAGDHIRVDGWLVEATESGGWRWRSSMTRDDTGAGACEVIYVCAITQL